MEIKCKVSFTLPEELIEALDITENTPVIAYITGNKVTLEFDDNDTDADEFDEDDYTEDDLYDEDDSCCEDGCDDCEYLCPHCGKCTLV